MTALLLALALAADPAPAAPPAEAPASAPAAPAVPALLEPLAAVAPPMPSLVTALPALSALAALGAAALLLGRKRRGPGRRLLQVIETAHLGPKRQLVVARLGGELLLLASSESGIALLSSHPDSPAEEPAAQAPGRPEAAPPPGPGEGPLAGVAQLFGRLRRAPKGPPEGTAFESLLQESSDDLELRRKLARGLSGRVA